jgi:putative endonuclease
MKLPDPNLGELGEELVARWLQQQGWKILHRRWHCPWGEIDLVAIEGEGERERGSEREQGEQGEQGSRGAGEAFSTQHPTLHTSHLPALAFVEVKTRSRGNWDADGLLAVDRAKQAKLCQAARLFLARYPDLADVACRFDVALVKKISITKNVSRQVEKNSPSQIEIGQIVSFNNCQLILQDYIPSAFDTI